MTAYKNIIKRQEVNFNYVGNNDGISLQQEVAYWIHEVLNPQIDTWLKKYDQSDEIISIPELKLDVDVSANTEWQQVLVNNIMQQLHEKFPDGLYAKDSADISKAHQFKFADKFLFYLKNGYLSWNTQILNRADFNTNISDWLHKIRIEELQYFIGQLDSKNQVHRFLSTLSEADKIFLFTTVLNIHQEQFLIVQTDINLLFAENKSTDAWQLSLLLHICNSYQQDKNIQSDILIQTWLEGLHEWRDKDFWSIRPDNMQTETIRKFFDQVQQEFHHRPRIDESVSKQAISDDASIKDSIYINNAGAIIIAPFLTKLFEKTGIVENSKIIDTDLALSLIHYCITGNTSPAEFELVLAKILCGIPVQDTVFIDNGINQKYQNEADEMLKAVIEHWSILKDSSINGLRESFLQREGKLSINNKQWLLQVEQQSYDMLLRHLPWNISMIRLPWMNELLVTEWV